MEPNLRGSRYWEDGWMGSGWLSRLSFILGDLLLLPLTFSFFDEDLGEGFEWERDGLFFSLFWEEFCLATVLLDNRVLGYSFASAFLCFLFWVAWRCFGDCFTFLLVTLTWRGLRMNAFCLGGLTPFSVWSPLEMGLGDETKGLGGESSKGHSFSWVCGVKLTLDAGCCRFSLALLTPTLKIRGGMNKTDHGNVHRLRPITQTHIHTHTHRLFHPQHFEILKRYTCAFSSLFLMTWSYTNTHKCTVKPR